MSRTEFGGCHHGRNNDDIATVRSKEGEAPEIAVKINEVERKMAIATNNDSYFISRIN